MKIYPVQLVNSLLQNNLDSESLIKQNRRRRILVYLSGSKVIVISINRKQVDDEILITVVLVVYVCTFNSEFRICWICPCGTEMLSVLHLYLDLVFPCIHAVYWRFYLEGFCGFETNWKCVWHEWWVDFFSFFSADTN